MSTSTPLYLVTFLDSRLGRHVTLRVREIVDSGLGIMFVRLSNFVLADPGSRVVDPQVEELAARFGDTRALHVNRMSIISVEEVSDVGISPLAPLNVVPFPVD